MRVVIDGLPIRGRNSLSIVSENLLAGWERLEGIDEVHLVVRACVPLEVPAFVKVHEVAFGRVPFLSRLRTQTVVVPRLCRSVDADVLLGVIPATTVSHLPCPRALIVWDFRYRLLPQQFSHKARWLRRLSYSIGFRQAAAMTCISARTKEDLERFHRRATKVPVRVAHLGADHVDAWPVRLRADDYAVAFGHFANKNLDLVIDAWATLEPAERAGLRLELVGVPAAQRGRVEARVSSLGLGYVVRVHPWLPDESFEELFASARVIVFPSDFEGFGLPAVEAMRLGIPVVITPEPALLEVTGGHAVVMDGAGPEALARAVQTAHHLPDESRKAAKRHAAQFTWTNFALGVRHTLLEATAPVPVPVPLPAPVPVRRHRPSVVRTLPIRAAAVAAAATVAVGGVAAASLVITSSPPSHPSVSAVGSTTSSTPGGTGSPGRANARDQGGAGRDAGGGTPSSNDNGTTTGRAPSGNASSPSPSPSPAATGGNGSSNPIRTLPIVAPSVAVPPVTVPTAPIVTAPSVTVPTTVCGTTTTTIVVTTTPTLPCSVTVPG